jgi:16S rRNA (guanine966-N2)-methyltransferase
LRIIGGQFRGLNLASVGKGDPAAHLRPTSDRVRESIFNLLVNGGYGDPVTGVRVLDLFAGTGALGLEALSRGAGRCTFVDRGAKARTLIRANIGLTRTEAVTDLLSQDATRLVRASGLPCGLVFLDPPYGLGLGEAAIAAALAGGWVSPGALVVWEESLAPVPPSPLDPVDQRRYGDTIVSLFRYSP